MASSARMLLPSFVSPNVMFRKPTTFPTQLALLGTRTLSVDSVPGLCVRDSGASHSSPAGRPVTRPAGKELYDPVRYQKSIARMLYRKARPELRIERPKSRPTKIVVKPASTQHFLDLAEKGQAGMDEATLLLKESMEHIRSLPQRQQRAAAAEVKASLVLRWLLGTDHMDCKYALRIAFAEPLCWHLEAEEQSQAVDDWLRTWPLDLCGSDAAAPKCLFGLTATFLDWPATMLAAMTRAKLYWSEDGTADSALENVFRYNPKHIDIGFAVIPILHYLQRSTARPCKRSLFERLFTLSFLREPDVHASTFWAASYACHQLIHPTQPNPEPMLQLCRSAYHVCQMLRWKRVSTRSCYAEDMMRAAYLLRLRGDKLDAEHLETISARLSESAWMKRAKFYRGLLREPKLERVHAEAPCFEQVWSAIEKEASGVS